MPKRDKLSKRLRKRSPRLGTAMDYALYCAVRAWSMLMNCFPITWNLATARLLGDIWWLLIPRHRTRALENLRPALGSEYSEAELRRIARASLRHFAQLYLVELAMTPQLVTRWTWARYVELPDISEVLRLLLRKRPVLLLTPHFGNYELVGYVIAKLGLPLTAVMRPLDNELLNQWLVRVRRASGIELLDKRGAAKRSEEILESGGAMCYIADQDAGRKGVFAAFFGRKASWYKLAMLAIRHEAPVVVGGAARVGRGFSYRVEVERIIYPEEWCDRQQPVQWITGEYAAALERLIRRHPEQYLWMHRRWKTRPKEERLRVRT